jgi:hypothetical protein
VPARRIRRNKVGTKILLFTFNLMSVLPLGGA